MFGTTDQRQQKTTFAETQELFYNVNNEKFHMVHLQTKWSRFEPVFQDKWLFW